MRFLPVSKSLLGLSFLSFAAALHAQCVSSLTFAPAQPVTGQPVTFTLNVGYVPGYTPPSNADTNEFWSWTSLSGTVYENSPLNMTFNVPAMLNFTVTPAAAGPFTVDAAYLQQYAPGAPPACPNGSGDSSVTLLVAPSGRAAANPQALLGRYVFQFSGSFAGPAPTNKVIALGSFTADGKGNITGGVEDINGASGSRQALPITSGTYTVDGSTGSVTLNTSLGPQHFDLFASGYTSSITNAGLIYTDAAPLGTGTLAKQAPYMPSGAYAVNWQGAPPVAAGAEYAMTPAYAAGLLSFSHGAVEAYLDIASAQSGLKKGVYETGTYGSIDSNGRFTYSLNGDPSLQQPGHFTGYAVDATHFFVISMDSYQSAFLFSGTAAQ